VRQSDFRYVLTSTVIGLLVSFLGSTETAKAQQIVRTRFAWNFTAPAGAVYFNSCDNPNININERTGGCAEINVLNEVVTRNRDRTRIVSDRLKSGQDYKACLVADNIGQNYQGRWIQCYNFVARDGLSFTFSLDRLRYVGAP
jgi:hypothetical protein